MLKVLAASILGRKTAERAETPKRVLARREIENLFHDDLEAHSLICKPSRKADPSHA